MSPPYSEKTGLPPGTVIYSGDEQTAKVKLTLMQFNEKEFFEKEFYDVDECIAETATEKISWINVDGIHDIEAIKKIGDKFNIHSLTLEDIANNEQRPKFEDYETYLVSVMKMIVYAEKIISEQLTIILLDNNTVLSFQEAEAGDAFDIIRMRIRQGKGRVRKMGADYLAYCLIDAVVDFYFLVLEKFGDHIEILEEELINNPSKKTMMTLHDMKREMIFLRKAVWPMRELINNFDRCENKLIKKPTHLFMRDLYDHTIRVIDSVETFRDLLSGMMDIYLSSVSNRMNEIMKVLTIISTIFIPVTFIAGVYGMNFKYMPELDSPYGYWITWGIMLAMMLSLVIYFKRKKWL
ncbi:MAG: magnesium/cobalt transporter CorA [Bacteroidetes bacterium]|nr:magnesium/cobalt transporter CorA [Bacteroidota bacterium]